jgi:hypothetical protein
MRNQLVWLCNVALEVADLVFASSNCQIEDFVSQWHLTRLAILFMV